MLPPSMLPAGSSVLVSAYNNMPYLSQKNNMPYYIVRAIKGLGSEGMAWSCPWSSHCWHALGACSVVPWMRVIVPWAHPLGSKMVGYSSMVW